MINMQQATFIKSAVSVKDFIADGKPSVLLAGRSNVGKSSLVNLIFGRKNFARVGAAPGKTTHINYFCAADALYIVDLPGYGYAKRSFSERDRWAELIHTYFRYLGQTQSKALGILVIDARHGPADTDLVMADYFAAAEIPYLVVANKCDKLKKSERESRFTEIRAAMEGRTEQIVFCSAENGEGKSDLLGIIDHFAQ